MIDFLKIYVNDKDTIDTIESLPFIHKVNSKRFVNFDTGQEFVDYYFNYGNSITFYWKDYATKNPLQINIKPHYYFNNDLHNANDLTPSNCIKILLHILTLLGIENGSERLKMVNLEYGINFLTPYADTECLEEVYLHGTNLFYNIKDLPYCKTSYTPRTNGKANEYKQFKFYGKAIQHPTYCERNTLRAEIKSTRSKYINALGIYTVADLLKIETYERLSDEVIKESNRLLFLQELKNTKALTPHQRKTIRKMNQPRYWQKLLKNNRSKFTRKKAQYFNILDRTGYNLTKSVNTAIQNKIELLNNTKSGKVSSTPKQLKSGINSTISIGRTLPTFKKCPITGVDITMQKEDSILLSNTGFKYLEKTNPREFERLKNILVTGNFNKFENTIYSKLSKQVRNRYYNNPSDYLPTQTTLF